VKSQAVAPVPPKGNEKEIARKPQARGTAHDFKIVGGTIFDRACATWEGKRLPRVLKTLAMTGGNYTNWSFFSSLMRQAKRSPFPFDSIKGGVLGFRRRADRRE
jgi:hypothetical protein